MSGECLDDETLLAFVDSRSPPAERARVERHVARCAICRTVLSELAAEGEAVASARLTDSGGSGGSSGGPMGWGGRRVVVGQGAVSSAGDTTVVAPGARQAVVRGPDAAPAFADPPLGRSSSSLLAADELRPGARVGRYVVLTRVGAGGMGMVYAAYDPELNRKVALKLLRPELGEKMGRYPFEERLRREAQAMARLAHPNVAAVYDVGNYEGRVFVAMEFVEGETLGRWLERERYPTLRAVLERYAAAGRGLAAAHAAGLVHRDFKPQNVLVGDDGRVRVVDFGLARLTGQGERPSDGPSSNPFAERSDLTAAGAVLGTPSYMAPEQHRGGEADARSDQFSFCVALYEALYRQRPFAGDTPGALLADIEAGRVRPAPRGTRVPRRVRAVLLRGLSASPEGRFPSIDALLSALSTDAVRRWQVATLGAVAAFVAMAGALLGQQIGDRRQLCRGGDRRASEAWGEGRRRAVEAALLRTGVPYAEAAAREVARALDGYTAQWASQYVEACEATRVRGEQTEELMGLRMACLDDRLRELRALGDRFAEADRDVAQQAVQAAHRLSGLEACADTRALAGPLRPPADLAARAEVDALRARVAEARSLGHAGRYKEGLEAARPIAERAQALRYRPLEAEAFFLVGELADFAGEFALATQSWQKAAWAAEAGRHDEFAARSLSSLILVEGYQQAKYEHVQPLHERVTAALERMGGNPELEAQLLVTLGHVDSQRGRLDDAEREFGRAITLIEQRYGDADLRLAEPVTALGSVALQRDRAAAARDHFERALAIQRSSFGDDHPKVAIALEAVARARYVLREYARAEETFKQALTALERAVGPEHPKVAALLYNLGLVYKERRKVAEAVALERRAIALAEKSLGPEHPNTAIYLMGLGATLADGDDLAGAVASLERALAILRRRFGDEHPRVAESLVELGRAQMKFNKLAQARESVQKGHALSLRLLGPDYAAGPVLRTLGEIDVRLQKPARALESLEPARRLLMRPGEDPGELALTTALIARALSELGRDRERAHAFALEAHAYMKGDERMTKEHAEFEQWMRKRALL